MIREQLNTIATFVQAAESGGFAAAADRMRVTRSAVGKSIARLEKGLGVRLFHRTTRRQSLTEDGQVFYERCVRALAEIDAAEAALDDGRRTPVGRLRVSVPVLFGRHCVAPVLSNLIHEHAGLQVEIAFSDRVADLVEEGFDLAVRIGTLPASTSLAARRLGAQRMGIGAAPSYLATHGHPENLEQLRGHTAITYGRDGQPFPWPLRNDDGTSTELLFNSRLQYDDLQAIADAAVAGVGIAWLPCWLMAPLVRTGQLNLIFSGEQVVASEINAVWPQTRHLPSKTRTAIHALVQQVPRLLAEQA
ncbi:MAG: LysR substrate-binding domain-containing protein [Steroidobacteraceae bacterium]